MKTLEQTIKDVERDLVISIVLSVRHKKMTMGEAKKLAKEFVSDSFDSQEILFDRLYELSNSFREARKVYVKYAPDFYEEKRIMILGNMRKLIKNNDIDNAILISKGSTH